MAILRTTGTKYGMVFWRGNVWKGDNSLNKFRITNEEYLALGQPNAGPPQVDPLFPGDADLWANLWSLRLITAVQYDEYDTIDQTPKEGDILLNAAKFTGTFGADGKFVPATLNEVIAAAKADTK